MADTFPLRLLLLTVSGWVNRHQQDTIAYLVEENRILKEKLGGKCPRLNDNQRRRLAALAKRLGRKTLNQVTTIVTPDTLMRWYRKLIAAKWAFPAKKRVGRPGLMKAIAELIVRFGDDESHSQNRHELALDDQHIYFTRGRFESDIWMMELAHL